MSNTGQQAKVEAPIAPPRYRRFWVRSGFAALFFAAGVAACLGVMYFQAALRSETAYVAVSNAGQRILYAARDHPELSGRNYVEMVPPDVQDSIRAVERNYDIHVVREGDACVVAFSAKRENFGLHPYVVVMTAGGNDRSVIVGESYYTSPRKQ